MKARPSVEKRRKELARQDRKQEKAERRKHRKEERESRPDAEPGEDPDLAGIVAGPQPLQPEFMDAPPEEPEEGDEPTSER